MSAPNRIRVNIGGAKYTISTPEPEEYVEELALEIDILVSDLMAKSANLSLNDALVLTALHYLDAYRKSETNADHLRSQISDYLEDTARFRMDIEDARREIDRLKKELQNKS